MKYVRMIPAAIWARVRRERGKVASRGRRSMIVVGRWTGNETALDAKLAAYLTGPT